MDRYSSLWTDSFGAKQAEHYDQKFSKPIPMYKHSVQLEIVKEWIVPGLCLEAPIGTGRISREFSQNDQYVFIGLDLSGAFLEHCRRSKKTTEMLVQSDLHYTPLRSSSISSIICLHTLFGLPLFRDILGEFMRVLKKGGRLIVDLPSAEYFNSLLYKQLRRSYPWNTQLKKSDLPRLFEGKGRIIAHYRHDWVGAIGTIHPMFKRLVAKLLVTKVTSKIRMMELENKGFLPQSFNMKHLIVVEKIA